MNTQTDKAALPQLSPVAYVLMPGSEVVSRLKQGTTKPFQAALGNWSVFEESQWHVFDGDLHVADCAFFANKEFVCILGNLTVEGNVLTGESNCKAYDSKEKPARFDDSFFIVKGDVRCKNFFNGELNTALINGNLIVDEVIYTSTMDSVLYTYGDIKARYLHSDGGWLSICNDGIHFEVEAWDDYIEFHGANAASIIRTGKCEQIPLTKYLQTQSDKKVRKLLSQGASILKQTDQKGNQMSKSKTNPVPEQVDNFEELARNAKLGDLLELSNMPTDGPNLVYRGDVHLKDFCFTDDIPDDVECVLILGNLTLEKGFVNDDGDRTAPLLCVSGDVNAKFVESRGTGYTLIGGDLHVQDYVYGDYNDGALYVQGETTARFILNNDHCMELNPKDGTPQADLSELEDDDTDLTEVFVPACFDDDEFDPGKCLKLVSKGKSPLLS